MATQTSITRSQLMSKIETWISSQPDLVDVNNNGVVTHVRDYINQTKQFNVTACNLNYHLNGVQRGLVYPFNNTKFKSSVPLFGLVSNSVLPLSNLPPRGDVYFGGFILSDMSVILTVRTSHTGNVYVGAIANSDGNFASSVNSDYTIRYLGEDRTNDFKNSRRRAFYSSKGLWYSLYGFRNVNFNQSGNYNKYYQIGGYSGYNLTGYATDFIYTKEPLTNEECYVLECLIAKKAVGGDETMINGILKPSHPYINGVTFTSEQYNITINNGTSNVATARPGSIITITANNLLKTEGKDFSHWQVVSGGVTLGSNNASQTTFTMPEQNVEITANYNMHLWTINIVDAEATISG